MAKAVMDTSWLMLSNPESSAIIGMEGMKKAKTYSGFKSANMKKTARIETVDKRFLGNDICGARSTLPKIKYTASAINVKSMIKKYTFMPKEFRSPKRIISPTGIAKTMLVEKNMSNTLRLFCTT